MSDSLIPSFLMSDVSESLRLLTKNERCERIAQVAHQKWAMWANRSGRSPKMSDVSKSLRLLTKNERPWANRSGRSPKMSKWANRLFFRANPSFAHFLQKNEQFAQKTDERIPSPVLFTSLISYHANSCMIITFDTKRYSVDSNLLSLSLYLFCLFYLLHLILLRVFATLFQFSPFLCRIHDSSLCLSSSKPRIYPICLFYLCCLISLLSFSSLPFLLLCASSIFVSSLSSSSIFLSLSALSYALMLSKCLSLPPVPSFSASSPSCLFPLCLFFVFPLNPPFSTSL